MKRVFSRPTKAIFTARATDPDRRARALYWLWINRHVFIVVKLSFDVDRRIRPRLQYDLDAFVHAPGRFLLIDAIFFVFMCLAALADAEIQAAVRNDIDHRLG